MIKFFRKIRQQLLSENKFTKYLIYAIGEIVLVVIGILIALNINNWNEEQKREAQEFKMLNELLGNLRMDSLDLSHNIETYRNVSISSQYVVDGLQAKAPWQDSMAYHYSRLLVHGLATLNTSGYDNLRSIGFDLITNDSIRIALTALHGLEYERILKFEQEFATDYTSNVIGPVVTKRIHMVKPWRNSVPHDYNALMNDLEFQEVVRWKSITMASMANMYTETLESTLALKAMIGQELSKKETQ